MLKFESLLDHLKFSENRAIFGPFEFMGQLEREVGWSHFRTIPNFGSVGADGRLEPFCDDLRFWVGWSWRSVGAISDHLRLWVGWSGRSVGAIFGPFEIMGRLELEDGWSHFRTI